MPQIVADKICENQRQLRKKIIFFEYEIFHETKNNSAFCILHFAFSPFYNKFFR